MHAMLPALALSRMRLQVPPGWSLKSLGRGSCSGLPTLIGVRLGFPWGGQHGQTPASRSSTRRASLGSPQRGVLQKMSRNGLRCLGCASLSPYIQEDAQISLPGGGCRARPPSSSPRAKLLQYLGWLRGRGNLTRAEAPNSAAASQRGWEEGAGKVLLLGCWLLPQPRAESSQEKAGGVPSSQGCPPVWEQPPGQRAPCQD